MDDATPIYPLAFGRLSQQMKGAGVTVEPHAAGLLARVGCDCTCRARLNPGGIPQGGDDAHDALRITKARPAGSARMSALRLLCKA